MQLHKNHYKDMSSGALNVWKITLDLLSELFILNKYVFC